MNQDQGQIKGNVDVNITKVLTIAVIGLFAIGAGWLMWRKIKKAMEGLAENREEKDLPKELKDEIIPSELTYDASWYKTSVSRLKSSFEGYGTTEKTVYDIVSAIKTSSDWKMLIVEFGTFKARSGMWPSPEITGNLATWLEKELSGSELRKVSSILAEKGITF